MKVKTLNGNLNIIGKNLKKYRKLRKFSQPEICKKLDLLGVTMYNCDIYEIVGRNGGKTLKHVWFTSSEKTTSYSTASYSPPC